MTGDPSEPTRTGRPEHAEQRSLHGRRHGRPLRPGRRRLLQDLLPKLRVDPPPPGEMLDLAALFSRPGRELWLEIGFGAGEHLAWQAEHNPDVSLLGAEVFVNGVAALLRHVEDRGLENVRIFQGDGRALLDILPPDSLERVFILFPDPWPKARHHKRRIVRRETLARLARLMKDGAELRLATDLPDYQRWMLERMTAAPSFCWLAESPRDWRERPADWPPTRYEAKAIAEGRRPVYLRFHRHRSTGQRRS